MDTQTAKRTRKAASMPATLEDVSMVKLVPLELIDTLPQLRKEFDQESIIELARDILVNGLLQPILLNPTGDRYQVIAGERRLKAVTLNGATGVPALLVKTSSKNAMLMQLAENIQREDLNLTEECEAIKLLYDELGNLDKVAETVKKSKPWCSKRYAMTQQQLHHVANSLLADGVTEDIELLKALSSLCKLLPWKEIHDWKERITKGTTGRTEMRAALKTAKEKAKASKEKQETVSHAKPKAPPAPPEWNIDNAIGDDLSRALNYPINLLSATELLNTWTAEQQQQVEERLKGAAATGAGADGFKIISHLVMNGLYNTPYTDIDLVAMIRGHNGKPLEWPAFLEELQCPREKA